MTAIHGWDDTIVALATPPGVGAIGVIRVSGSRAFDIVNTLFPSKDLTYEPSHTLHVGFLKVDNTTIDEVVLSLFRAPRSYTGEDVIEISCHGSPFVQQQVIEAVIAGGARLAKPGEFTQRAFLNGKLDLAQAEAVADLIASGTRAARDTALHAMRGGFSKTLAELREEMVRFSALIELELDFSQEDVEFADRTQFYALLRRAQSITDKLIESFRYGNVIRNGVRVAIVGRPNAGKSTLLNALLNENRAIVSDIAGTTRDTIEEVLNIDGILFRLIDTAGLRDDTSDVIERAGIDKTQEKIREADIIVHVFDASGMTGEEVAAAVAGYERSKLLVVANKVDLVDESSASLLRVSIDVSQPEPDTSEVLTDRERKWIRMSARTGAGLDALRRAMFAMAASGDVAADGTIVTNVRHFEALKQVMHSLNDIVAGLDAGIPLDLIALDIRRCLHWLGEITGEVTTDEQLTWIFSKFCIGK